MGLKNCQIQLDNPWNTYYAGQTINGQVTLTFDSPKKVRDIQINFCGKSETSWKQKHGKIMKNLTANETYFDVTEKLLVKPLHEDYIEIVSGLHVYPFKTVLPTKLPSSFEDKFGYIRYTIKVTVCYSTDNESSYLLAFTVISPVDLNQDKYNYLKEPGELELDNVLCCYCYCVEYARLKVNIPVQGYVPGQFIPITCECKNSTSSRFKKINFRLHKYIRFIVKNGQQIQTICGEFKINQVSVGPIPSKSKKKFNCNLIIPPLPSSNFENCKLIALRYFLIVEIEGLHQSSAVLKGSIPITIGTVPLISSVSRSSAVTQLIQNQNYGGAVGWNVSNTYDSFYPPLFFECHSRTSDLLNNENDSSDIYLLNENGFAPRYPTFSLIPHFGHDTNESNVEQNNEISSTNNEENFVTSTNFEQNNDVCVSDFAATDFSSYMNALGENSNCNMFNADDENLNYTDFTNCETDMFTSNNDNSNYGFTESNVYSVGDSGGDSGWNGFDSGWGGDSGAGGGDWGGDSGGGWGGDSGDGGGWGGDSGGGWGGDSGGGCDSGGGGDFGND